MKAKPTKEDQARLPCPSRVGRGYRLVLPILTAVVFLVCTLGSALLFHNPPADDSYPTPRTGAAADQPGPAQSSSMEGNSPPGPSEPKTAAIVDQLSLTYPNPAFAQTTTAILERAGYAVTYTPGEQVTVEFYRNLPGQGYDLILLRVHSGVVFQRDANTEQVTLASNDIILFTGEAYIETKYPEEQKSHRVGPTYYYEGAPPLFGISPAFVKHSMRGKFNNALIIAMGCYGLLYKSVAQAFLDKGAGAVLGWSEGVSAEHTDAATEHLLTKLLIEELTVTKAIAETNAEIGPDPLYKAELRALLGNK